ncbi:MAG: hypothetical protein QM658_12440 [Gordonia sp. (in: high G+C Gram-positive bacteria)]
MTTSTEPTIHLDHAAHRNELKAAGITVAQLRAAENAGEITEFRTEFFGPPALKTASRTEKLSAAIAAYARYYGIDDPVATSHTAAQFHGLPTRTDSPSAYRAAPLYLLDHSPTAKTVRRTAAEVFADKRPRTSVTIDGVEVATIARTLVDMLHDNKYNRVGDDFLILGDHALNRGLTTVAELESEAELLPRSAVRNQTIKTLARLDGRCATKSQTLSRKFLHSQGFPAPEMFTPIYSREGDVLTTPTFCWPDAKVVAFCVEPEQNYCDAFPRPDHERHNGHHHDHHRAPATKSCPERNAVDDQLRNMGYHVFRWIGDRIDTTGCDLCHLREALDAPRPYPNSYDDPFCW